MIKSKAYAKINLSLNIIPNRLKNGLYPVRFINCQIDLYDELYFDKKNREIEIICDNLRFHKKDDNIVYKAAVLLRNIVGQPKLGARIVLKKNIPVKAGLGGGSSDAAATTAGLMKLWNIKLTDNQRAYLADELGKDVHYCLVGGLCQVSGDGSTITSLRMKMPKFWLVIVSPEEKKPSTKFMYKNLDIQKIGKNTDKFNQLKQGIQLRKRENILYNLFNDFEDLATQHFSIVGKIKSDLIKEGALRTLLAGSGLSVIGFFNKRQHNIVAFNNLKVKYKNIIWTKTL